MQLRRQKIQPPPREVLERQVLERMIVDRAQMQLARETGVRVDDGTVNAAIGRVAESNGLTVPALRQRLEADGLSFNQFREDIRQDIILSRLREREVDNRIQISESELDNFVAEQAGVAADAQEVNIAQILLRVPENADSGRIDETRKRAEDLLGQLNGGADFARLAASFSNATEALQGGELGWRNVDRLPSLFIDAIRTPEDRRDHRHHPQSQRLPHPQGARSPQRDRRQAGLRAGAADARAAHPAARQRPDAGTRSHPPARRSSRDASKRARSSSARWRGCTPSIRPAAAAATSGGSTRATPCPSSRRR